MMTWEFQSTIADDVHRVLGSDGRSAWGVVSDGFDDDDSRVLDLAEVALPDRVRRLLIVPASPGGLVLDVVRAYQGLTEAELCTLFLGIVEVLRTCTHPDDRLTLSAFALDAAGRPELIPGVSAPLATTPRRAVGEMIYHAAYGRPWAEALLPIDLALDDSSSALRTLVAALVANDHSAEGLRSALAEVADSLRTLARPAALPLVPADSELAPESALTARLRAASGHRPSRDSDGDVGTPAPPLHTEAVSPLRAGAQRPKRSRRRRRRTASPGSSLRAVLPAAAALPSTLRTVLSRVVSARRSLWIGAAVCLTLLGGMAIWASWPSTEAVSGEEAAAREDSAAREETAPPSAQASPLNVDDVTGILEDLCAARAQALGQGDAAALQALTVPESTAAAADELIDLSAYSGSDYAIDVEDVEIVTIEEDRVVASALMRSSADSGAARQEFAAQTVEFELNRVEGTWLVAEVTTL